MRELRLSRGGGRRSEPAAPTQTCRSKGVLAHADRRVRWQVRGRSRRCPRHRLSCTRVCTAHASVGRGGGAHIAGSVSGRRSWSSVLAGRSVSVRAPAVGRSLRGLEGQRHLALGCRLRERARDARESLREHVRSAIARALSYSLRHRSSPISADLLRNAMLEALVGRRRDEGGSRALGTQQRSRPRPCRNTGRGRSAGTVRAPVDGAGSQCSTGWVAT